jgi:nucleotide-binding universal stress UspA family protein
MIGDFASKRHRLIELIIHSFDVNNYNPSVDFEPDPICEEPVMNKLLVAYDGSRQSEKAFSQALEIASKFSAKVVVLSVARPPEPPVAVEMEAVLVSAMEHYEAQFDRLRKLADSLGVEAGFEVRAGHPAEQIVLMANEENADAIVIGHRGGSFLQRWLLGSVAKRVLSYAHCTVIVVR